MSNLSLQSVELTTSQATAPANGPPSSADYNEYQRSVLVDLASLADLINDTLIPLITPLDSSALGSTNIGIEGSTVYSDTTDQTDTFYDSVTDESLVVADSLRVLRALISQLQTNFQTISIQLATLQSQNSSINQSSLSASLAGLVSQIQTLTASVSSNTQLINTLQAQGQELIATVTSTGSIPAESTIQVQVNLTTAYADNNYVVSLALQDATGQLQILSYTYQSAGQGIFVLVKNNSTTTSVTGNINTLTKHF